MNSISPKHPRFKSLIIREQIIHNFNNGSVVNHGLIAHGRGEAFDYLIGETTIPPTINAIKAAAFTLLNSQNPVISVNGNTAALVPNEIVQLSNIIFVTPLIPSTFLIVTSSVASLASLS